MQEAVKIGIPVNFVAELTDTTDEKEFNFLLPVTTDRWSLLQAVFFASTVLTTIGSRICFHTASVNLSTYRYRLQSQLILLKTIYF